MTAEEGFAGAVGLFGASLQVLSSCLPKVQRLQRREVREDGGEGGGASGANLVIAAAWRRG